MDGGGVAGAGSLAVDEAQPLTSQLVQVPKSPSTPQGAASTGASTGASSTTRQRLNLNLGAVDRYRASCAMRVGSTPGSGRRSNLGSQLRAPSAGSNAAEGAATALAVINRQQAEALEARVAAQLKQVQQNWAAGERARDALIKQLEVKLTSIDTQQRRLERTIAETSGMGRGVSDELQSQIRRIDQLDSRMWDWKRALEEEPKNKFVEIEQQLLKQASAVRLAASAHEDTSKKFAARFAKLEGMVEEQLAVQRNDLAEAVAALDSRLHGCEEFNAHQAATLVLAPRPDGDALAAESALNSSPGSPSLNAMRDSKEVDTEKYTSESDLALRELKNAMIKVDSVLQESHDIHVKLEHQEQYIKTLRNRMDTFDMNHRKLSDRVEVTDVSQRFKELHSSHLQLKERTTQHDEQFGALIARLDMLDSGHKELHDKLNDFVMDLDDQNLPQTSQLTALPPVLPTSGTVGSGEAIPRQANGDATSEASAIMHKLRDDIEELRRDSADRASVEGVAKVLQLIPGKLVHMDEKINAVVEQVSGLEKQIAEVKARGEKPDESNGGAAGQPPNADDVRKRLQQNLAQASKSGGLAKAFGVDSAKLCRAVSLPAKAHQEGSPAAQETSSTVVADETPTSTVAEERPITAAQWNLAGINANPLEFRQTKEAVPADALPAFRLVKKFDRLIEDIVNCSGDTAANASPLARRLASKTAADLLATVVEVDGDSSSSSNHAALAIKVLEAAPKDEPYSETLRRIRGGDKALGRAQMKLQARAPNHWSLLKLNAGNAADAISTCARQDRRQFWTQYFKPLADAGVLAKCSSSGSSASPAPASQEEYEITLDHGQGSKIGIHCHPDHHCIVIEEIQPFGLVASWIKTNPDCIVECGDKIYEVNGIGGDTEKMFDELEKRQVLKVKIKRGKAVHKPPLAMEEMAGLVLPFEALLFEALSGLLIVEEDQGGLPATERDGEALGKALTAFVDSMCADAASKASEVGRTLQSVARHCQPDVISLQEFNNSWCELPEFKGYMESLTSDYEVLRTQRSPHPEQVVLLLIRKDGTLKVDKAATDRVVQDLLSKPPTGGVVPESSSAWSLFKSTAHDGSALGGTEAIGGAEGETAEKFALAVCHQGRRPRPVLVVAAHAKSDGTNNRAMCRFARCLAEAHGCDLMMALDANSAAEFSEKDLEKGAANQHSFLSFIQADGLRHCYPHFDDELVADPKRFHTVRKTRTFLQCQLKKAGHGDVSAKDFVLIAGHAEAKVTGVRVNRLEWLATPSEGHSVAAPPLPSETDTWDGSKEMPAPQFASDHCMVIAQAVFPCV